jgi:hypothetical protein
MSDSTDNTYTPPAHCSCGLQMVLTKTVVYETNDTPPDTHIATHIHTWCEECDRTNPPTRHPTPRMKP